MSEIDRIRTMAADGTITDREAEKLIALLADIDQTEEQVDAVAAAAQAAGSGGAAPPDMSRARVEATAPDSRSRPAPDRPTEDAGVRTTDEPAGEQARAPASVNAATGPSTSGMRTPEGFRWFKIATLAGDLDVRVDASLDAPEVDGPEGISVRETGQGYELDVDRGSSFFDRLMSGRFDRHIDIRLPENIGVDLRIKAGDVELRGVPYLKGHILAGDVDARGLRGVDLSMSAGDLDLWLTLTEGEHRVNMTAGDVHVRLDPASDVNVEGRVSIGDASMPAEFSSKRSGIGESFSGTIGNGTARLSITQSTGDAKVSVDRE